MATQKSIAFHTLGCKLNFAETSSLKNQFEEAGYWVKPFEDLADIYVVNTCSVTDFADRKCRKIARKIQKRNAEAIIVMTGCYAQLKPKEISEIPGVDLVLGAKEKFRMLEFIDQYAQVQSKELIHAGEIKDHLEFHSSFSLGDRTRSFLKIQDGCDYKCSFCTIPLARGLSRSDSIESVVEKAEILADKKVKEIVLTGVNIGDFGLQYDEGNKRSRKSNFLQLIQKLDTVSGIERFRISSIEPNLCTNEIIEFVAQSQKFMPHFHMPLQSGNDKQLKMMRRRYDSNLYSQRVQKIKELIPHACIGVDVIVGFPNETDDDFLQSFHIIESLPVSYLHVFTYSERNNTLAAEMDQIPMESRRKRNSMLRNLSSKKTNEFYKDFIGTSRKVLIEKNKDDQYLSGFSDNYIKIKIPFQENLINTIQPVYFDSISNDGNMNSQIHHLVSRGLT
jgi:threonylcarbamoyladenosine tRNA methylthiotransferase MtaB